MRKDYGTVINSENYESTKVYKKDEKQRLLTDDHSEHSVDLENLADDDPIANRDLEHPTSNFDTLVHLLKGNIGTGILAMPDAFRNSGWAVGLIGTMFMGVVCTHCMHLLVDCSHELCRRTQRSSLNFAEVVDYAVRTGPGPIQRYNKITKCMINVFLCITQLGFCCVYFVFVAANLHDVIKHYWFDMGVHWYLIILLIPMILLNLVKSLKYLTPASLFASILTCTGLVITFLYMLHDLPDTSTVKAVAPLSQLPLYFGVAMYAFEGIGVVLPLENNMKTPKDFGGWNGVLNTGMIIVASLYTAVGFFGYVKYGDRAVLGSVTLLLPPNEFLAQSVRLVMATAIFLSYSLQFYVPFNIVWPWIKSHFHTDNSARLAEHFTRILLIFITFALAIAIPNLGAVISLVGAFSSSALALIFPPLINIITFYDDSSRNKWMLWKDLSIVLFGVVGFVVGSYVSLLNILHV